MNIAHWFGIGFLGGIALFFILLHFGVIDKWFEKWNQ